MYLLRNDLLEVYTLHRMNSSSLTELASHDHDDNTVAGNPRGDYKCRTCKNTFNKKVEFIVSISYIQCPAVFTDFHIIIILFPETCSFTQTRIKEKT